MARYSFLGSIPPKFEHKLRRHKQSFGKIATTVVLDKDENLLWSGLQRHRSCHSNEMTLLPILLAAVYLGTGNCSSKIVHESFFLQQRPWCSSNSSEICKFANILSVILCLQVRASDYLGYCVQVSFFRAQQQLAFLNISNSMLFTAVHVKMKLGDNTFNNDRLSLVMTKLPIKN